MRKQYVLWFQEGFQFKIGPDPMIIGSAKNHKDAIKRAADYLEIEGEVTLEKFQQAGGKEIICTTTETVFPA